MSVPETTSAEALCRCAGGACLSESRGEARRDLKAWLTNRIRKVSFFLTTGGAPYDVRWRAVSPEAFETMRVFIELPVLQRALEEVFGAEAAHARLRDASAFDDFDRVVGLDGVPEGYRAMNEREALKVMVRP